MDEKRRTRLVSLGVFAVAVGIAAALAWMTKDMTNIRDQPACAELIVIDGEGEHTYHDVFVEERPGNVLHLVEQEGRARDLTDVQDWTCTPPE